MSLEAIRPTGGTSGELASLPPYGGPDQTTAHGPSYLFESLGAGDTLPGKTNGPAETDFYDGAAAHTPANEPLTENSIVPPTSQHPEHAQGKRRLRACAALAMLVMATFRAHPEAGQAHQASVYDVVSVEGSLNFGSTPATYDPRLIVRDLADPGIVEASEDSYYLSGTSDTYHDRLLPIYHSTDLTHFTLVDRYNPSKEDPKHTFCNDWAPDLSKKHVKGGEVYDMYFTAEEVPKGEPCQNGDAPETIFHASSPTYASPPTGKIAFGKPTPVYDKSSLPHTSPEYGCPESGCENAMRSDPAVFYDASGKQWIFYVWRDGDKHIISSFQPSSKKRRLVTSPQTEQEGDIDEAPFAFSRNAKYYLIYSDASYKGPYAMNYIMADSVADLTRKNHEVHALSTPIESPDGTVLQNMGHCAVVERDGKYYLLFHEGKFNSDGQYLGRDTYIQQLAFNPNGTIQTINTVSLNWQDPAEALNYSLDIEARNGTWIDNCFSAQVPDYETSIKFEGVCPSDGDTMIQKGDISAFRLNFLGPNGKIAKSIRMPYDGHSDTLDFADNVKPN